MSEAEFRPLTKIEAQAASEVEYMFTVPVKVDYGS